ncbi:MAG TPA: FHA domain-containing protein, partial [Candidatus Obscuribacterales bacterium]
MVETKEDVKAKPPAKPDAKGEEPPKAGDGKPASDKLAGNVSDPSAKVSEQQTRPFDETALKAGKTQDTKVPSDFGNVEIVDPAKQTKEAKDKEPAPSLDRQTLEKHAQELHDALHNRKWLGTRHDADEEKVWRLIEPLNQADRKALEQIYKEKFGAKDKEPNFLRKELKDNLSEVDFRRAEAVFNRKDGQTNDAGALMVALTTMKDDPGRGNKELRVVLQTLTAEQIARLDKDFRETYGKGFMDAITESKKLSKENREALSLLTKGSDKRDADDIIKLANIAVDHKNKEMFGEMVRGDSATAIAARERLQQDQAFMDRFNKNWKNDQVMKDFLKEGRVSLATIARDNTDNIWFLDNKDNVKLAAKNASDKERADFAAGREMALSGREPQNASEREQLEFYKKLHKAFKDSGNDRDVAVWEDQILRKGSLVTEMVESYDDGWGVGPLRFSEGTNKQELFSKIENMSEDDWKRLTDKNTGGQFRRDLEQALNTFADKGEKERALRLIDEKAKAPSFEESKKVRRSLVETIEDNKGSVFLGMGTKYEGKHIVDHIANMPPQEAEKYRTDAAYRRKLDDFVDKELNDTEKLVARRMLDRIAQNKEASALEKAADRILLNQIKGAKSQEALKDIETLLKDKNTRERLNKPEKELSEEDRKLRRVIDNQIAQAAYRSGYAPYDGGAYGPDGRDPVIERFRKPLFEEGRLPVDLKMQIGFEKKDVFAEIASPQVSDAERQRAMARLKPEERQIVESAIKQNGELTLADRMRGFVLKDGSNYQDFKEELEKLSNADKQKLKDEYARKYGSALNDDFLNKVDDKDLIEYKTLLTPTKADSRQIYFDIMRQLHDNGGGVTADGTEMTVQRASQMYAEALEKYGGDIPENERKILTEYFGESLEQYKASKEKLAEIVVDATITVAAVAATIASGGVLGPVAIAAIAAGSAAFRVAAKKAIQGGSFKLTEGAVLKEGAIGALTGGLAALGPETFALVGKTGQAAALSTGAILRKPIQEGVEASVRSLVKEGAERTLSKELGTVMTNAAVNGEKITVRQVDDIAKKLLPDDVVKGLSSSDKVAKAAAEQQLQTVSKAIRSELGDIVTDKASLAGREWVDDFVRNTVMKSAYNNAKIGALSNVATEPVYSFLNGEGFNMDRLTQGGLTGLVAGGLAPIGFKGAFKAAEVTGVSRALGAAVEGGGKVYQAGKEIIARIGKNADGEAIIDAASHPHIRGFEILDKDGKVVRYIDLDAAEAGKPVKVPEGARPVLRTDSQGQLVDRQGLRVDEGGQPLKVKYGQNEYRLDSQGRLVNDDGSVPDAKLVRQGTRVNEEGRFIDEQGRLVDDRGRLVDAEGRVLDETGKATDVDGRRIEGNHRDNVERKFADYDEQEIIRGREQTKRELAQILASENPAAKGKESVLDRLNASNLSEEQKNRVLDALAEVREHYVSYRPPGGRLDFDQEVNWIHTQGELGRVLDSAKRNGLTAQETEDALLASMFSDSVKAKMNFFQHHLDGALAADHVLRKKLGGEFTEERLHGIIQAIREHQISPPGFMAGMYTGPIRAQLEGEGPGYLAALGKKVSGEPLTEADQRALSNLSSRVKDGKELTQEEAKKYFDELTLKKQNGQKLVLDADVEALRTLSDKMGFPMGVPHEGFRTNVEFKQTVDGGYEIVLSDHEKALLRRWGQEHWYVPNKETPWYRISQTLIDGDSIDNYATAGGYSKIVKIRGPETDLYFRDGHVDDSLKSIVSSREQSLRVMSAQGQELLHASVDAADASVARARARVDAWLRKELKLRDDEPLPDIPFWSKRPKLDPSGKPEIDPKTGQEIYEPVKLTYPDRTKPKAELPEAEQKRWYEIKAKSPDARTPAEKDFYSRFADSSDEDRWWAIHKKPSRTQEEQAFYEAHRFDGLTEKQIEEFKFATRIRDRFADELRKEQRVLGDIPPDYKPAMRVTENGEPVITTKLPEGAELRKTTGGEVVSTVDHDGVRSQYEWETVNGVRRLRKIVDSDGVTFERIGDQEWKFSFASSGNTLTRKGDIVVDEFGTRTTIFAANPSDYFSILTKHLDGTTEQKLQGGKGLVRRNANGHVIETVSESGRLNEYIWRSHDGAERLEVVVRHDGTVFERTGDDSWRMTEPGGQRKEFKGEVSVNHNGELRLRASDNSLNIEQDLHDNTIHMLDKGGRYWIDREGLVSQTFDAANRSRSFEWEMHGESPRIKTIMHPDGSVWERTGDRTFSVKARGEDAAISEFKGDVSISVKDGSYTIEYDEPGSIYKSSRHYLDGSSEYQLTGGGSLRRNQHDKILEKVDTNGLSTQYEWEQLDSIQVLKRVTASDGTSIERRYGNTWDVKEPGKPPRQFEGEISADRDGNVVFLKRTAQPEKIPGYRGADGLWYAERNLERFADSDIDRMIQHLPSEYTLGKTANMRDFIARTDELMTSWGKNQDEVLRRAQLEVEIHKKLEPAVQQYEAVRDEVLDKLNKLGINDGQGHPDLPPDFSVKKLRESRSALKEYLQSKHGSENFGDIDGKVAAVDELTRLSNELAQARKSTDELIKPREAELQKLLDDYAEAHGLPKVSLTAQQNMGANLGSFLDGDLKVRRGSLISADKAYFMGTLYHELTHNEQQALMVRYLAEEFQRTTGRVPSVEDVRALYHERNGRGSIPAPYVEQVLALQKGQPPLTAEQRVVVERLADAWKNGKPVYDDYEMSGNVFREFDSTLNKLNGVNGKRAASKIFDEHIDLEENDWAWYRTFKANFDSDKVDPALREKYNHLRQERIKANKGEPNSWNEEEARKTLIQIFEQRKEQINGWRERTWSAYSGPNQKEEWDAWLTGELVRRAARQQGAQGDYGGGHGQDLFFNVKNSDFNTDANASRVASRDFGLSSVESGGPRAERRGLQNFQIDTNGSARPIDLRKQDVIVLGRNDDADISFKVDADDPSTANNKYVSRPHAQLEHTDRGIVIKNLSTTNKTFVNGHEVPTEGFLLNPNESYKIRLSADGPEMTFGPRPAFHPDKLDAKPIREYLPPAGMDHAAGENAVRTSNRFRWTGEISEPLPDGFQIVGGRGRINADGSIDDALQPGLVIDRQNDRVLAGILAEARKKFDTPEYRHNPEKLARDLTDYVNQKMTPRGWDNDTVSQAYGHFRQKNAGKRVYLGEYIEQAQNGVGGGVGPHQAALLKVLADDLGLEATLVKGHYGAGPAEAGAATNHMWTEIKVNGERKVYDPRFRVAGESGDNLLSHTPERLLPGRVVHDMSIDERVKVLKEGKVENLKKQEATGDADIDGGFAKERWTATIDGVNVRITAESKGSPLRLRNELAAQTLAGEIGFDYPATTTRTMKFPDGTERTVWIQEDLPGANLKSVLEGRDLDQFVALNERALIDNAAQDIVFGLFDANTANKIPIMTDRGPVIHNIDMDFAFSLDRSARPVIFNDDSLQLYQKIQGKPLPVETVEKLRTFAAKYVDGDGNFNKDALSDLVNRTGLSREEAKAVVIRARDLAKGDTPLLPNKPIKDGALGQIKIAQQQLRNYELGLLSDLARPQPALDLLKRLDENPTAKFTLFHGADKGEVDGVFRRFKEAGDRWSAEDERFARSKLMKLLGRPDSDSTMIRNTAELRALSRLDVKFGDKVKYKYNDSTSDSWEVGSYDAKSQTFKIYANAQKKFGPADTHEWDDFRRINIGRLPNPDRPGDLFTVRRSSGAVETGWKFEGVDPKTGQYKFTKSRGIELTVTRDELAHFNPELVRAESPALLDDSIDRGLALAPDARAQEQIRQLRQRQQDLQELPIRIQGTKGGGAIASDVWGGHITHPDGREEEVVVHMLRREQLEEPVQRNLP